LEKFRNQWTSSSRMYSGMSKICLKRQILDQKNDPTLLPKKVLCHNFSLHLERVIYGPTIRRT
ncbi:MAG: hypothetical protein V4494_06945, partial [Chlamydiota bacterium]